MSVKQEHSNLREKGGVMMRNILITAMMIMVVVLLFINIVTSPDGIRDQIEQQGTNAIDDIRGLAP